jgi:phosphoribosylformimino-5-aminoimidazole carboxamide ribotide isomerase
MILYPAIDIRGGRCVRLVEGDFDRETIYDSDPSLAARRWVDAGAEWLHVVDLDGAVAGRPINGETVAQIRAAVDVPIQFGGGLRQLNDLEGAFGAGVERVILGTAALQDPDLVSRAGARWGDRIAVALDTRDGQLATDGWLGQSDTSAVDLAQRLAGSGIRHFVYTDIRRDGTLAGPDLRGLSELIEHVDANVIASGGIASLEDIRAVANAGAAGVIIGRALYDGRISLGNAVALFGRSAAAC